MSEKTLAGLGLILVILLVLWGGVSLFSSLGGESSDAGSEVTAVLERISEEGVTRVVLEGPSDTVSLEKANGGWTANGFATDSAAVADFWSAVSGSTVRGLVAENPTNHARLGVAPDSAWSLEAHPTEGDPVRLLLGDQGASFNSVYVRLPDRDRVYTLEGNLRRAAARGVTHWRDKTVVAVDTSRIRRVEVAGNAGNYVLTRDSTSWLVDGEPANGSTARSLVGGLTRLEAQDFAAEDADFESGEERWTIRALGEAGDTLAVLELASTPGSTYLARTPGREWLFELPRYRVTRLTPEREDLVVGDASGR